MSWKLTHPDTTQVLEVDTDSIAIYLSQGWRTASGRTPTLTGDAPLPSTVIAGHDGVAPPAKPATKKK